MAWIKTIPFDEADDELRSILTETRMMYPPEYAASAEKASMINESIVDSHTLIPEASDSVASALNQLNAENAEFLSRDRLVYFKRY